MPKVPEASNPLPLLPPPHCSSPIPRPFRKGHPLRRSHLLFLFLPLVIEFNLSVTSSTSYHILLLFLISTGVRLFISIPDFYRYPGERNADEAPYFRALDLLRPNCSGLFTVGRTWRTGFVSFSRCFSFCNLISLQKIPSNRGKLELLDDQTLDLIQLQYPSRKAVPFALPGLMFPLKLGPRASQRVS